MKFDRQLGTTCSGPPIKFQNDWRTLNRNLVRPRLNDILGYTPWWWWKTNAIELRSHYKGFIVISDHNIYDPPKGKTDHPSIHHGWSVGQPTILVQSPKSGVAQRTTHGVWLGGSYYLWVVRICCGQKWRLNPYMTSVLFIFSHQQGCGVWGCGVCGAGGVQKRLWVLKSKSS